jgi:hypothetical protein
LIDPFDCFTLIQEAWIEVTAVECGGAGVAEDVEAVAEKTSVFIE